MDDKYRVIYDLLTEDFEQDAYVTDRSRGFPLIGMRGAFIVERLNEVFGLLGHGWRFAHSPFVLHNKEVTTEVLIQYNIKEIFDLDGSLPYIWDSSLNGWTTTPGRSIWSEPIFGVGGNQVGSGGVPMSDAEKSAVSSGLSKAASRIGVGIKAYKGKLVIDGEQVSVKGEDAMDKHDAEDALEKAIVYVIAHNPDEYEELRKTNRAVANYHGRHIITPLIKKIMDANLKEFVSENLGTLVNDKSKDRLTKLSLNEILFVGSIIGSLASNEVTWETALDIAPLWDRKMSWNDLLLEQGAEGD